MEYCRQAYNAGMRARSDISVENPHPPGSVLYHCWNSGLAGLPLLVSAEDASTVQSHPNAEVFVI